MQRGERRRHLPDDPRDNRRVKTPLELAGGQFRQSLAGNMRGYERQVVLIEVHDGSNGRKRWMTDSRPTFDPVTHSIVEAGSDGALAPESEELQRNGVGVVEHQQPIAESITSSWSVPTRQPRTGRARVSRVCT